MTRETNESIYVQIDIYGSETLEKVMSPKNSRLAAASYVYHCRGMLREINAVFGLFAQQDDGLSGIIGETTLLLNFHRMKAPSLT